MKRSMLGFLVLVLAGCAAPGMDRLTGGGINVERIDSPVARIGLVRAIDKDDATVHVSGTVQRRPARRGPIPGHIDMSVITNGEMVERRIVDYRRRSIKSLDAHFFTVIRRELPSGTVIRLRHHEKTSG